MRALVEAKKPSSRSRRTEIRRPARALDGITLLDRRDFAEFVAWYLAREARKGRWFELPADRAGRLALLEREHGGKTLAWFSEAMWWRARIETQEALERVLIVRSEQAERQGLIDARRPRTLGVAVDRLLASGFFDRQGPPGAPVHPFHRYYRRLSSGQLVLQRRERLVVRSLSPTERSEAPVGVELYLHDGVGRAVPYLALLRQGRLRFRPIDVYAALAPRRLERWSGASLRHSTGEPFEGGWRCRPRRHPAGHATFGPYSSLPGTSLTVRFGLAAQAADRAIACLDVYDARRGQVLTSREIEGGGVQTLPVENTLDGRLEFRVFWYGRVPLEIRWIDVWLGKPPA